MTNLKLPIGIDNFLELRERNYTFVDKSLFVKEVLDTAAKIISITRPRRFGKTLNLSMLEHYFSIRDPDRYKKSFDGLKITKAGEEYSQHQNQYPVIFISLKSIKADSYEDLVSNLRSLLGELYNKHSYVLDGDVLESYERDVYNRILNKTAGDDEINRSLLNLSEYLHKFHNKKAIILIDEYDTPVHNAYMYGFHKQVINLLRGIMGNALKGNDHLEKAVVTGILRISKTNMFSDLNNIKMYTMLNPRFAEYFGFTPEEVSWLLSQNTANTNNFDMATNWYNGYKIGAAMLYNPWSIINFIDDNYVPSAYWVATGGDALIRKLLASSNISTKRLFEELLQGNEIYKVINEFTIFDNLHTNPESIWGLLLFGGYLTVTELDYVGTEARCKLKIPNREITFAYDEMIKQYFSYTGAEEYQRFIESLVSGNMVAFQELLQTYINESTSYFDLNARTPEQVYHMFVLGLVLGLRDNYYIQSNRESGIGRCDVIMLPKDKSKAGLVLEFKTAEKPDDLVSAAQAAIKQIDDKGYEQQLKSQGIKIVNTIGIAFAGKNVHVEANIVA